ncbi:hypothetical protein IGI04_019703 [Brassica rapa subsp. trilocularis]|uniref:Uncharacterized protein n=1 Tax=Brassica rapa subsp. trilocularis TaxID=1813537 RepID=A0ABQ7MK03_BRACM|nr:hypothetical protein IGI04_019703 [Brassica rapa subsp. trilocularis]
MRSSEYTDEIPRNIPMKYRGNHISSEFLLIYIVPRNFLGIFRGNSEEHMFGEISRKNKCSSEFPRHSPRLLRRFRALLLGFPFLRKSLGIFRGNSDGYLSGRRNFLGIFSFNRANKPPNISRKLKLKILRKFRRKISEVYPSEYSDDIFLGIFRGLSDELVVLGISSEFRRKFPRDFRGKMNFRGVISEDFFSSVCRRNSVIPTTYRRFFPSVCRCFLVVIISNVMSP